MLIKIPFDTTEVRWFFGKEVDQYRSLKHWFEKTTPIQKDTSVGPLVWEDRRDVYLIVPGSNDMGIKWREGQLQIKGCISSLGTRVFCGRHRGKVERWTKWSYANIPSAYHQLFLAGKETGLVTASVGKNRALRKVKLDTVTGEPQEVDAGAVIDRGFGFEFTELELAGKEYYSLAFEAFPIDPATDTALAQGIELFLEGLTEINLTAANSQSYPAWLNGAIRA